MKVLLTGFGPFPGVESNASGSLALQLADEARDRFPQHVIQAVVLETTWRAGLEAARREISNRAPDFVIHFGVSEQARGFVIERRAHNTCDDVIDACGLRPTAEVLGERSIPMVAATLPVDQIAKVLAARGLPHEFSDHAGAYLCNAVLYQTLSACLEPERSAGKPRAGFIHLPKNLGQMGSSLTDAQAIEGGLAIVGACVAGTD